MDLEERLGTREATRNDWQVFGDMLIERGDPRGELTAVSIALETAKDDATIEELERRREELTEKVDPELTARTRENPELFELEWEYGFLDWARIVEPWNKRAGARAWLRELLTAPAARFLRSLEIDREGNPDATFAALAKRGLYEWAIPVFEKNVLPQVRSFSKHGISARAVQLGWGRPRPTSPGPRLAQILARMSFSLLLAMAGSRGGLTDSSRFLQQRRSSWR
jgi:hypothetical protein